MTDKNIFTKSCARLYAFDVGVRRMDVVEVVHCIGLDDTKDILHLHRQLNFDDQGRGDRRYLLSLPDVKGVPMSPQATAPEASVVTAMSEPCAEWPIAERDLADIVRRFFAGLIHRTFGQPFEPLVVGLTFDPVESRAFRFELSDDVKLVYGYPPRGTTSRVTYANQVGELDLTALSNYEGLEDAVEGPIMQPLTDRLVLALLNEQEPGDYETFLHDDGVTLDAYRFFQVVDQVADETLEIEVKRAQTELDPNATTGDCLGVAKALPLWSVALLHWANWRLAPADASF